MRHHFKAEHFLCEEDECAEEEFTAVFRTEIDLKAHKATVHSKSMSRMEARQARILEIDISYGPRGNRGHITQNNGNSRARIRTNDTQREFDIGDAEPQMAAVSIDAKSEEQFPSLAGPSTTANQPVQLANSVRHVVYGQSGLARTKENFPALGSLGFDNNQINLKQSYAISNKQQSVSSNKKSSATASSLFKQQQQQHATPSKGTKNVQPQKQQSGSARNAGFKNDSVADFPSLPANSVRKEEMTYQIPKQKTSTAASSSSSLSSKPQSASAKKESIFDFPSLPQNSAKKNRELLMEDLILPTNNNIDKAVISSKHRLLVNDYVSMASQLTKVNIVKQKDDSTATTERIQQNVPTLSSSNNFPSLGGGSSSGNGKIPQWLSNNNQKQQTNNAKLNKVPQPTLNNRNQHKNNGSNNNNSNEKIKNVNNIKENKSKKTTCNGEEVKENRASHNANNQQSIKPPPPPGFKKLETPGYKYKPVVDASKRNQALVSDFQEILTANEAMQEFRLLSQMFREGNYFARSYYESCRGVLGEKFDTLFPELIALLPDIEKQQVPHLFS
jgi:hypothetical protein